MPLLASRSTRLASATGALLLTGLAPLTLPAAEESIASPDGRIVVTVGDTAGGNVEVLSGLRAGERIVVRDGVLLND